jgi:hypothetical protein
MSGGVGGGDENFPTYKGIVGYAIFQNALVTPASNWPYRVVFDGYVVDGNGNHVEFFEFWADAMVYYGGLIEKDYSSAVVCSNGSIFQKNKNYDDIYLQRAFGWDYLCETQFPFSCNS